jgi:hypothetical protein
MGTYKVPQNVEAEDKILGPLSIKQFIYAIIGLGYGFLTFAILKSLVVIWILVGVPPMLFLLALGLYQKEDQPLETYVVAVAQFIMRPKSRMWHKEPIAEVFRVEPPPPKVEPVRRDPGEVRSQLQQLAELVDTRGWSAKEPELQEPEQTAVIDLQDRIGAESLQQQQVPVLGQATQVPEVTQEDDMLAEHTVAAQNLNVLIENTVKSVRQEALEKMRTTPTTAAARPVAKGAAQAITTTPTATAAATSITTAMTGLPSGDILKLAAEGGDLTVAQIAAQAHKQQTLVEGQAVDIRDANISAA